VSDNIAPLLVHASYNDDCNLSCNLVGSTLNWTIASIAPNGGSATLTFSVTLDGTFPTGTTHLPNVVIVTGPGSNCAAESQDPDCDTDTTVATSVLTIDKAVSGNTGGTFNDPTNPNNPLNGLKQAKVGDTLTYSLHYTGAGALHNAVITDPIPVGLEYVAGSATGDTNFSAGVYNGTTRTITWNQPDPTVALPDPANGTLTFKVKVLTAAAEIGIIDNVATIDSDETLPDTGEVPVGVLPPPLGLTPPPTDTFTPQTATSNPGFALMLILLGVAGLTLGIGFITPAPARVRRRDRLG
jgi:fimbrial isopeptide formation D2 family protein